MSGAEPAAGLALPGEPCEVTPHESWSNLEKWVWHEICSGRIADFNKKLGKSADPRKLEDWQDGRRRLTPRFLEHLLLREPYRTGLHRKGVRIDGAWFDEAIDLSMAELACPLWLDRSRFEKATDLKYLRTPALLSLDGSCFAAQLDLQGTCIDADLVLRNSAVFNDVALNGAKVGGQVDLTGAKVAGTLNMDAADIGRGLFMRIDRRLSEQRSEFNDVVLNGAKVGGQVDLTGAKVAGALSMDAADIGQSLFMRSDRSVSEDPAEFNDVVLKSAKVGGHVDLNGAKVTGTLNMDAADIGQSLFMSSDRRVSERRAEFSDVVLNGAKIGGQIALIGAKVTGTLSMDAADIGQSLLMRSDRSVSEQRAEFSDVVLRGTKVGGNVDLIGARVAGTLNMDSADISQSLFMRSDRSVSEQRAEFSDVVLNGAKVGRQVSLTGAKVAGALNMGSANIGESLFMHSDHGKPEQRAEFNGSISLIFAEVGRNLDVRGAVLSSLDLTGTRIDGELRLASSSWSPRWQGSGKLILRNARVDAIGDTAERGAWPPDLELDGFAYRRFGGLDAEAEAGVAKRGSRWFIDWLTKDEPYTPQPYQQCAHVLREMGHPELANDVLYAGRERERKETWQKAQTLRDYTRSSGLWLLQSTVGYGYGYRYFRSLRWVLLLVLVGLIVLLLSGSDGRIAGTIIWTAEGIASHLLALVFYSLDLLLPIVELYKPHYDVVLNGFAKYYFAAHKLFGYVLASFLIAGLAGLTK